MKLTKEQFEKLNIRQNDYDRQRLAACQSLLAEIKPYIPDAQLFYIVDECEQQYYFRTYSILFERNGLEYTLIKMDKYYRIYADFNHLKNITRYDIQRIEERIGSPNQIGVLSPKKVDSWIRFYAAVYAELKALNEKNGNAKAAFLESLKGEHVQWRDGGRKGYIIRNGIKFQFTIDENYISTEIETTQRYGVNIETFRQLADNRYVEPNK